MLTGRLNGGSGGDVLAVEQDLARGRKLEAGDQAKQGCLAAARRTQQREEFIVADRDSNVVNSSNSVFA